MLELWKDIEDYNGMYQVSNLGNIKSLDRLGYDGRKLKGKLLIGGYYPNGYRYVSFRKDYIDEIKLVHRLVAKAFIPNPDNLKVVNHEDGVKSNNVVSNLNWSTQSDNLKHAVEIGLMESQCKIRRSVTMTRLNEVIEFKTVKDCCSYFGHNRGWLSGRIKRYGSNDTLIHDGWLIIVHGREN
jgi:hypothetical protein